MKDRPSSYVKRSASIQDALPFNWNLSRCYIALDRLQDARAVLDHAKARNPDKWQLRGELCHRVLAERSRAMDEEVQWAKNKPGDGGLILKEQSETAAYYGRSGRSRRVDGKGGRGGGKDRSI